MNIAQRQIGNDHQVYVIAELGVNHDGSVDRALQLVDDAAAAGADAIKLQLFSADLLMGKAAKLAAYQKSAGESDPLAMLRRLELTADQMAPIVARAHARGLHAIVTVFSVELVESAERLNFDAYKTASPDIVHTPLLERLMATGKPLIVSTGASTLAEIARAVNVLEPARDRLALLQCVSSYPTPHDQAELGGILALREEFSHLPIGYSDHTPDTSTAIDAVNLGACLLEKHFTYSTTAVGPDHAASLEREGLRLYCMNAKGTWTTAQIAAAVALGLSSELRSALDLALSAPPGIQAVKRVLDIENDVRTVSRQSITAARALPAGHVLTRADLTFKRPGTGLLPFRLTSVLGRRLARDVEADMPLLEADIGPT